jgi:hypothetical protein
MSPRNLSRRAIMSGAASVPALAGPALALPPALASAPVAVDPIYAAIEAHRTANLEFQDEHSVDEDHPQYEKEMQRLSDAADVAAGHLCDVQPMTIAGAIALLNYYAEVTVSHDGEDWPVELEDKQDGVEKPFGYFLTRNVARALGNISAGGEAVLS